MLGLMSNVKRRTRFNALLESLNRKVGLYDECEVMLCNVEKLSNPDNIMQLLNEASDALEKSYGDKNSWWS